MGIESFSLIMDFLVSILLCAVVFYAIRLNRYFVLLNSQRQELASQLNTFADSTRRAEQVVAIIKATTAENATLIERQIRRAEVAREDIDRALSNTNQSQSGGGNYSPRRHSNNANTPSFEDRGSNNQNRDDDSLKFVRPVPSEALKEGQPIQVRDEIASESRNNRDSIDSPRQNENSRARMREIRMQQRQNNPQQPQNNGSSPTGSPDGRTDTDGSNVSPMPIRDERPTRSRSELLKALQGMR